ncbi:hypothetical protein A5792_08290 [Mycolicibacterium peregrinum]|uniref:Uncharacterized protein n=1 Tax=Mycolicibacterium peregrinum TaxID=43304 RepID=A0A1A0QKG4_MYCPR|nr:hypothetical protein A5792_08290 [Mycolicibacterium peregrinum]
MTRRRWWILGVIGVAAMVAVAGGVFVLSNRPASDCAVVRSMLDYNKQFGEGVNAKTDAWTETTDSDYTQWATHLRGFADQIRDDPGLAEHADKLADLADQTVKLVPQARADLSTQPQEATAPPPSAREYSRIAKEFNDNLVALDNACPR